MLIRASLRCELAAETKAVQPATMSPPHREFQKGLMLRERPQHSIILDFGRLFHLGQVILDRAHFGIEPRRNPVPVAQEEEQPRRRIYSGLNMRKRRQQRHSLSLGCGCADDIESPFGESFSGCQKPVPVGCSASVLSVRSCSIELLRLRWARADRRRS